MLRINCEAIDFGLLLHVRLLEFYLKNCLLNSMLKSMFNRFTGEEVIAKFVTA